jgi:two-component system response regulator FixJ
VADPLVHVIDDDQGVRDSLAFLLDCAGLAVRTHASADDFLSADPPLENACIVTDVRMPGMNGLELLQHLRASGCSAPVIVMTGHADVPMAIQAMKAGVADFLEKPFGDDAILEAISAALARSADRRQAEAEQAAARARIAGLSPRERDVLNGLVEGRANKVIASDLDISPRTVEVYRANVMTKMGARSLSELVRMVVTGGGPEPASG